MLPSRLQRMLSHGYGFAAFVWGAALGMLFLIQVFTCLLGTTWADRTVPNSFTLGFLNTIRSRYFLATTRPLPNDPVPALARQVAVQAPAGQPLEVVRHDTLFNPFVSELAYALYPRRFSQRLAVPGDNSPKPGCRIDLLPKSVVTFSCAGSTALWRSSAAPGANP